MRTSEDDINLRNILQVLMHRRWWILAASVVSAAFGVFVALTSIPIYRAEILLAPIKQPSGIGGMQALSSQLGGLASLVGVSLGGSDDATSIATLKSHVVTRQFIADEKLLPVLYADKWDAEHQQWKISDPKRIPTLWTADEMFSKQVRKIIEDRKTGMVTLSIEWKDPKLAAQWAQDLVVRTNTLLRTQAIDNARKNIAFLQKQVELTDIIEVRQSMNRLLEEQWKQLMLAQGDSEYALKTVDPAVVPEGKINLPKRLVVIAWSLAGFLLSCIAVLAQSLVWVSERSVTGGKP